MIRIAHNMQNTLQNDVPLTIGVARGCSGCTCTPRAVKFFFRRDLQGKCVSAPLI